MGCGCNKTNVYEVTRQNGSVVQVKSQSEAVREVRENGGSWRLVVK
jgi:hypothetical protein